MRAWQCDLYLRKTWWSCWAKEAKRAASAKTRPPRTAVNRVDLRRHRATTRGVHNQLPLNWMTPIHTASVTIFRSVLNVDMKEEKKKHAINDRKLAKDKEKRPGNCAQSAVGTYIISKMPTQPRKEMMMWRRQQLNGQCPCSVYVHVTSSCL